MARTPRASAASSSASRRGRSISWRVDWGAAVVSMDSGSGAACPRGESTPGVAGSRICGARSSESVVMAREPGPRQGVTAGPAIGSASLSEASREGVEAGQRPVRDRDLPAAWNAELAAQDVGVRLRCPRRDAELEPDLLVRVPGGDQLDDLLLAPGDGAFICEVNGHAATLRGGPCR